MPSLSAPGEMPPDDKGEAKTPWKKVAVQDEFLLGLTEPGFQDLEILDTSDYTIVGDDIRALIQRADEAAALSKGSEDKDGSTPAKPKKKKKRKKANASKKTTGIGKDDDGTDQQVDDLLARVSALEAENDHLRKSSGTEGPVDGSTPPEATAAAPEVDMSAWDDYGLHDLVISSLAKQNFTAPTDIQHECLPAAIMGNADIVGAAQTGSGKTLAFGLPIINFLVKEAQARAEEAADAPDDKPDADTPEPSGTDARSSLRALILCPTRELALQVADHLSAIAKPLCIRVAAIVGGISVQKQARLLRYRPPIVVATPGRLWDLMRSGAQHVASLRHLAFLTLDEADRMVARGHYEELTHILSHIPKRREALLGKRRGAADPESRADGVVETHSGAAGDSVLTQQATLAGTLRTYVFSATLTLPDGVKARLQRGKGGSKGSSAGATLESLMETLDFRGKPKIADLTAERKIASKVVEAFAECSQEGRDDVLYYLLHVHPGRTLAFLNTISSVRRVAAMLKALDINAQVLHAQQQQRQRMKALARFRADPTGVLVATDVAARGLDVPDIAMVVQYQLPPTADTYIHRAGRTARAGAEGVCVSLVVPGESARFSALHTALGRPPPREFPVDAALLADVHARVRLALRVDELERTERKETADSNWRHRNAEAIGVDLDEGPSGHEKGPKVRGMSDAKLAKKLRAELQAMLAQPLRQRMNSKFFTGGTSQAVARSLAAAGTGTPGADAAGGEEPVDTNTQVAVVDAAAMRESVAEAQRVVQRRAPGPKAAGKKRKHKVMTMAQHQAAALQSALVAKRLRKARKAVAGSAQLPRGEGGQGALAAIRAAGPASL